MKIINYRSPPQRGRKRYPKRAPIADETAPAQPPHSPAKKALLIGISYQSEAVDESNIGELKGPHRDVHEMMKLLIEVYDYHPDDITVMLDSQECTKGKIPTRTNILNQVKKLVQDAQPGDRFFFHYAGHASQVENRNNSEEDGMDECLVPVDGEDVKIKDDELRRYLVDALPIGSQLIAVFDSCHSASMLDLSHHRCNRVYVPWISKGRRKSATLWNRNIRKHGMDIQTRRIYQSERTSQNAVRSRRTSIEVGSPLSPFNPQASRVNSIDAEVSNNGDRTPEPRRCSLRITTSVTKIKSSRPPSSTQSPTISRHASPPLSRGASLRRNQQNKENSFWPLEFQEPTRCTSPVAMYPCDGNCRTRYEFSPEPERADVISLSACKDGQISWEDGQGIGMSQILIQVLRANPTPSLKDLLTSVSYELHKLTFRLHSDAQSYRKNMKIYRKYQEEQAESNTEQRSNSGATCSSPTRQERKRREKNCKAASDGQMIVPQLNLDNFQDPQLSSHIPLDMDSTLKI